MNKYRIAFAFKYNLRPHRYRHRCYRFVSWPPHFSLLVRQNLFTEQHFFFFLFSGAVWRCLDLGVCVCVQSARIWRDGRRKTDALILLVFILLLLLLRLLVVWLASVRLSWHIREPNKIHNSFLFCRTIPKWNSMVSSLDYFLLLVPCAVCIPCERIAKSQVKTSHGMCLYFTEKCDVSHWMGRGSHGASGGSLVCRHAI